ncbi:fungal mating type pheromone-like peptide [Serpula lacrymans var. lacrymans S7.3]|uniref:Fungal mating type pheromone-like peptide n=2 Tax=Serpula lacrymans var. lacrymans TaxID=341189 RepID=F8PWZ5_SERL3|nr:fungal mating-type pheromone-like peptide [Serpula lacrymans var. lacrymans S7.9]EGN99511.1 fungal mating type pheromone-like peptide [Serpula lacrymans var. lacrymans S7.3]EGO25068.1 fungal mating-type pheromone-like peptide [Serpula lacrymans var. lacrymans S7.9]
MDSFTAIATYFTTSKAEETNLAPDVPTDEDSGSSGGNSYCVVA